MPKFDTVSRTGMPPRRALSIYSRFNGGFRGVLPWHVLRIQAFAVSLMSTLLLVSGETGPGQPSGSERSVTRRGQTLKSALERAGYDVVQVEDAASALARLGEAPPDLVVLAGPVPDMELLEFCVLLRRDPAAERIPFVIVAEAAARTGRAASRAGADLVFPATVGPTEIADRLRRLF